MTGRVREGEIFVEVELQDLTYLSLRVIEIKKLVKRKEGYTDEKISQFINLYFSCDCFTCLT